MTPRLQRLSEANKIIASIARHGRRFFYYEQADRTARFELTLDGRLYFRDDYINRRVYVAYRGHWRNFSHGGTMRRLVEDLADFIRTGEPISRRHFGPWPQHLCWGDLWGYGREAMDALRAELSASPAIHHQPTPEARS